MNTKKVTKSNRFAKRSFGVSWSLKPSLRKFFSLKNVCNWKVNNKCQHATFLLDARRFDTILRIEGRILCTSNEVIKYHVIVKRWIENCLKQTSVMEIRFSVELMLSHVMLIWIENFNVREDKKWFLTCLMYKLNERSTAHVKRSCHKNYINNEQTFDF